MKTKAVLKAKKPLKAKGGLTAKSVLKASQKPSKQAKPTITALKKVAIKLFNRAIKYRDGDFNTEKQQWVFNCITCNSRVLFSYRDEDGKWRFKKTAHAGHFMPCHKENTRFDEENVNGQCGSCNYNQGEQYAYSKALDLKYGVGTADKLTKLSKISKQWTIPELQQIIDDSLEEIHFYETQTH